MSMEDYLWKYSIPMIKIMGIDNSHERLLSEKEAKRRHGKAMDMTQSAEELNSDLGLKIKFPNE